jgi:hypothetical protein
VSPLEKRQLVVKSVIISLALAAFAAIVGHYVLGDTVTALQLLVSTIVGIPVWTVGLWLTTPHRGTAGPR